MKAMQTFAVLAATIVAGTAHAGLGFVPHGGGQAPSGASAARPIVMPVAAGAVATPLGGGAPSTPAVQGHVTQEPLSPAATAMLKRAREDADAIARLESENALLRKQLEHAKLVKELRESDKGSPGRVDQADAQTFVSEIFGGGHDLRATIVSGTQSWRVAVGSKTPLGSVESISAQGVLVRQGQRSTLIGLGEAKRDAGGKLAGASFGLPGLPTLPSGLGGATAVPSMPALPNLAGSAFALPRAGGN